MSGALLVRKNKNGTLIYGLFKLRLTCTHYYTLPFARIFVSQLGNIRFPNLPPLTTPRDLLNSNSLSSLALSSTRDPL